MKKLFPKILQLPKLKLSSDEMKQLTEITNSHTDFDQTILQDALPSEKFMQTRNTILAYANVWLELTTLLLQANKKIASIWQELFNEPIEIDNLLIITINLLPEDQQLLTKLQQKIKTACDFSQNGEAAFTLANLFTALTDRLKLLQEKQTLLFEEKHKQVLALYLWEEKISDLHLFCFEYLNYLANLFAEKLKSIDKISYAYYFGNVCSDNEKILKQIITEVGHEEDQLPSDPNILHLIYKHQTLNHMLETFSYPSLDKEQQLILFALKFSEFQILLKKNADKNELGIIAKLQNELPEKPPQASWYEFYRLLPRLSLETFALPEITKWLPQANHFKNGFNFFVNKFTPSKIPEEKQSLVFIEDAAPTVNGPRQL